MHGGLSHWPESRSRMIQMQDDSVKRTDDTFNSAEDQP
jgi:hypothetical protein